VALSPAGSVVVYLNSSTAAPAGAAQDIKLRLTRGGALIDGYAQRCHLRVFPCAAAEPLLAIMRRLG
jgi:hypothetical protein